MRSIFLFEGEDPRGHVVIEMLFLIDRQHNQRRRPDLAYVSQERWPLDQPVGVVSAWDVVPDLAVEFISPTDQAYEIMDKIGDYFRAGVRAVWVVSPNHQWIYVYDSPKTVRISQPGDELDGGPVLPGYRVPVAALLDATRPI